MSGTIREHLSARNYNRTEIDMEEVYKLCDDGMSVKEVAQKLGVDRSTLYRRHKMYQEALAEDEN